MTDARKETIALSVAAGQASTTSVAVPARIHDYTWWRMDDMWPHWWCDRFYQRWFGVMAVWGAP